MYRPWRTLQDRCHAVLRLGLALLILAPPAHGQLSTGFEPPAYAGAPAGQPIGGQDGWSVTGPPTRVFTYAGNTLGLPQNPLGGTQFASGISGGSTQPARALRACGYAGADRWTATWDVAVAFSGAPSTVSQLGSFSLEDAATQRYWQARYNWTNPTAPSTWNASYAVFDASGAALPAALPGPAWQNLSSNRWYRQSTTWDFATNQVLEVTITDLTTGVTTIATPSGWFLHGGAAPVRPRPTGISISALGTAGNTTAWDNLGIAPVPFITGFVPPAGTVGDIISISGGGFGTDPDALSVEIINGSRSLPLTVISAGPTQVRARLEPLPQDATAGPIRITLGSGRRGGVTPQLPDIIPEDPQGVWVWQRAADPGAAQSTQSFIPTFQPPPPGVRRSFGALVNGSLEVLIDGNRAPNSLLTVHARLHNSTRRIGAALSAGSIRLRMPGDAQHTAERIRDVIISAFAAQGVPVSCDIAAAGTQWRITVQLRSPQGQFIPADLGALAVFLQDPLRVDPFAIGPVTAFHDATLSLAGGSALIGNLGPQGDDGATVTPLQPAAHGIRAYTGPIVLDALSESLALSGWGIVNGAPDRRVGGTWLANVGGGLELHADFLPINAPAVRVEVWRNSVQVGSAVVTGGLIGRAVPTTGPFPAVIGLGQRIGPAPGFWITFDRAVTFTPVGAPPLLGNQLRVMAQGSLATVEAAQALDLAAGLAADTGSVLLDSSVGGDVCYANCDGSSLPPILNVADFTCYLQQFAAGAEYANCDGSTIIPVLNVADFTCFLQSYAAGCVGD